MISERIRQLLLRIAEYDRNRVLRVFPIPYKEDESELHYLRRANSLLEKAFMQTSDLIEDLRRGLEPE